MCKSNNRFYQKFPLRKHYYVLIKNLIIMKLKCKYNLYFTPGLEHKKNMTKEDFESKL